MTIGPQPAACAGDEPEGLELLDALPDLRDERPAGARHDDVLGRAPAQLFDDLESVALGPLRVIRSKVHVHERPAVLVGDLRAQPVDLVVGPVHGHQSRVVDERGEYLALLEVGRNEDVGLEPALSGVGRHGIGEVARGRAGDRVVAELLRLGHRDRDDAVLERPRGVADRVVLDPDLPAAELVGEVLRADQRCEPDVVADGDVALDRQQVLVPPHRGRPGGDRLARDDGLERVVPIIDLERTEAELADVDGGGRVATAALTAPQAVQLLHRAVSIGRGFEPRVLLHRQQDISTT